MFDKNKPVRDDSEQLPSFGGANGISGRSKSCLHQRKWCGPKWIARGLAWPPLHQHRRTNPTRQIVWGRLSIYHQPLRTWRFKAGSNRNIQFINRNERNNEKGNVWFRADFYISSLGGDDFQTHALAGSQRHGAAWCSISRTDLSTLDLDPQTERISKRWSPASHSWILRLGTNNGWRAV